MRPVQSWAWNYSASALSLSVCCLLLAGSWDWTAAWSWHPRRAQNPPSKYDSRCAFWCLHPSLLLAPVEEEERHHLQTENNVAAPNAAGLPERCEIVELSSTTCWATSRRPLVFLVFFGNVKCKPLTIRPFEGHWNKNRKPRWGSSPPPLTRQKKSYVTQMQTASTSLQHSARTNLMAYNSTV